MSSEESRIIFISWSGENSKRIAIALKDYLEMYVLRGMDVECFVSDQDIAGGAVPDSEIIENLKKSIAGIICFTKENYYAPWIYFEAGAMQVNGKHVMPLLADCKFDDLKITTFKEHQAAQIEDGNQFAKRLGDMCKKAGIARDQSVGVENSIKLTYGNFLKEIKSAIKDLQKFSPIVPSDLFPASAENVKVRQIYISAQMDTLSRRQRQKEKSVIEEISDILRKKGASKVFSPLDGNKSASTSSLKAVHNYKQLKEAECLLVVFSEPSATSVLTEVGYGIALSKRIVIFYRDELPYMLKHYSNTIDNVRQIKFRKYSDITKEINTYGMNLFY